MKSTRFIAIFGILSLLLGSSAIAQGQEKVGDVMSDRSINWSKPADRARAVQRIQAIENASLERARAKAKVQGIPMRRKFPDGKVTEIVGLDENDEFIINITHNANAAISTAANKLRVSPYMVDGAGIKVGVWDAGSVLFTHQEFNDGASSRVNVMDGAASDDHSTHVGGTIAAAGISASAKGMAPAATVDSYNWTSDESEVTSRAATGPTQHDTKIYISNHSYGYGYGWDSNVWSGSVVGTDQNAYDADFGKYSTKSRNLDSIAYNAPYYLAFYSAGNEGNDNPNTGANVTIGGSVVTYNPAIHPAGDGKYRNGFETIGDHGIAKNVVTVGAANDAVTSGQRDPAKSTLASFSSTGPTDDGRIKPDVVGNGVGLTSAIDTSNTSYGGKSGTSMSSPNVCGTAALLVDLYRDLFAGSAMRASTLKGLLIHTASDIGNPGPDYKYGWGLVDAEKAAELLTAHAANPTNNNLVEDRLTTATTSRSYSFAWDGSSPIRATLSWTDPAGTSTSTHDSRTARLVNNLNLKLIAPNGAEYFPYVMPFVGTWTVASMSQNAITGINNTDNVEQVYLANPGQNGVWLAEVTYTGSLTNSEQYYGLIFSGLQQQADEQAPTPNPMSWASAPAPGANPETQITMTASTATDASGVEYYFAETSGTSGGTDSGWQDSPTYTDSGLFPGTQYTYTVTARDKSANQNTTTASSPTAATTSGTQDTTPPNPNPMTFASFPVASGTTSIIMTAATASDLNGVEYLFEETSGNSGGTNSAWQNSPTYQDTGLLAGTAYTYTVTARDKSPNQNTGTASSVALAYTSSAAATNNFANADIAVSGSVTGSYTNTLSSNNSYEQLTEVATTGKPADRISYLEHKWSFNVTGGTTVTFNIEAYHTANTEGDNFVFAYSTNGVNGAYTNMLTVTKTADNNAIQSYTLPSGISGTVHVRVLDTDRSAGNYNSLDSLYIDSMYFVSGSAGGGSNPPTLVSIVDNQAGGPIEFNTPVTYTVTFSKDMDAATVTAADFGNAGTSTATFGSVSEISPGVFTVQVTPTTTGSLKLRINAVADLRDVDNNAMITTSALTDDVTINVTGVNAGITLGNLNQTYNGSPKPVSVTTNPTGLTHTVTYNESATVPSNAGTYPVVATITDPNYSGSASGSLVIAKASQTINFAALTLVPDDQTTLELTATATSGLPVSYTSSNTDAATVSGSTVTIIGLGSTTITASQAGGTNYNAASNVQQTLTVVRANPLAVSSGPYKVLIGQTLALNGSGSFSSYSETLTAHEWDLNNDNTFGDATGATPSAINFQTLIDTWGMTQGLNTIQLKVTDSSNKTSTISTTVELVLALAWDANGTTAGQTNGAGAWLDANKWWDGTANTNWVPGSDALFGGVATNGGTVTLASPTTANSIIFNQHTGTYTLGSSGQTITLNEGITLNPTVNAVSIISPVTLSGSQTWTNNGSSLSTSRNTNLIDNNGFQLTVDGTGITNFGTISNAEVALAGSGDLVKNGIGRLNLGGVNSGFTGKVAINGGVIQATNNPAALGNGNVTLNDGVLSFYWGVSYNPTLGSGNDQVQLLGGASGFAGAGTSGPSIDLGSTVIWGASGEGAATGFFNPDKFVLGDSGTTNAGATTFSNGIDMNGVTRTIVVPKGLSSGGNVSRISGEISSSITAGLIKEGGGTLVLEADNTYLGDTTISGGSLRIGNNNSGSLNGGDYSGNISIASNATLEIWSSTAQILSGEISGAGGLNKAYGGELTLTGANTYTGSTSFLPQTTAGFTVNITSFNSVNGGSPAMASSSLGAPTTIDDGIIDIGNSGKRASVNINYTGPGEITDRILNFGFNDTSTQTLTASGSGLLKFTSAMTSNTIGSQSGKLILAGTGSGEITEALPDLPSGGLTKNGSGTWTLGGSSSYTGPTAITAGKLFINGSLSNIDAALSVASGATLGGTGNIGRNVTIADGGMLEFDISTPAASHDQLDIGTGRSFDFIGASELTITSTAGAGIGTYTLVTGGNNITGVVPITVNLPVGWTATVSISGNSLLLNVTSIAGGVAGSLVVAEPENLISSGSVGGPFSPNTIQYTLSNPGDFPIEWTVGNAAAWVDLSATFGTLAAGTNTIVTISLNSNTGELGEGSYNDTITFTNTSNSNGNTTRAVSLSVNPLPTYTISYNGNGNTGGTAPTDQTKTENIDLSISGPGTLERTGYSFTEWNAAANGSGIAYGASVTYTDNAPIDLYAQWSANSYTVTFDPNGGDAPSPMSKLATFDATYGTLATTSRTGHTFNGWFTAADGGVEVTSATSVATASNHTLYAQWTVNTYTVTYDSNTADGGTAPESQIKNAGEDLTLSTNTGNLFKIGYTLTGWNIVSEGNGTHYDLGAIYPIDSDITLYAEWTLNTAGFSLSKVAATVAEDGGTDSFTVVLDSQPVSDVVIDISSSDTNEATVSPVTLTFTNIDWDTPQTVTITGINDDTAGDNSATITASVNDASSDDAYDALADQTVDVTCTNDDTAGFTVTAISGNTDENGTTATFTVALTSQPTDDVTIGISSSDTGEGTVNPTSLNFTNSDWSAPQTVTVTGVDDAIADGPQAYTIVIGAASSLDTVYNGIDPDDVSASNIDNEVSLASWIGNYDVGSLTAPGDDYDGDGLSNALENYFGTDPSIANSGLKAEAVTSGANTSFTFSHPINANPATDISASYHWSKDMTGFNNDGVTDAQATTVNFTTGTPVAGMLPVSATVSGTPTNSLFVRIEVIQATP